MARFARENPHLVQYEVEFFWKRDHERQKAERKKEDESSSSRVIKVESDDEVQPDDEGEEYNTSDEETMTLWNSIDSEPDA